MSNTKWIVILIITIGIMFSFVISSIRFVWKKTETGISGEALKVACLEGGGKVIQNDFGVYISCEKNK